MATSETVGMSKGFCRNCVLRCYTLIKTNSLNNLNNYIIFIVAIVIFIIIKKRGKCFILNREVRDEVATRMLHRIEEPQTTTDFLYLFLSIID